MNTWSSAFWLGKVVDQRWRPRLGHWGHQCWHAPGAAQLHAGSLIFVRRSAPASIAGLVLIRRGGHADEPELLVHPGRLDQRVAFAHFDQVSPEAVPTRVRRRPRSNSGTRLRVDRNDRFGRV